MNRILTAAVVVAFALSCGVSQAQITIDSNKDTGIFGAGFNNGVPNFTSRNLGSHTHAPVGRSNSDRVNRGLFEFDIAGSVPAGSTIATAVFEFEVTQQGGIQGAGADDFDLHEVTTAWVEGTGTGNVGEDTFNGASWDSTDGVGLWAALGGDFVATPLGSVNVDGPDGQGAGEAPVVFQITSPALADYVQDVLDGVASNNGLLLKAATETVLGSASRVTTREGGNAAKLIVTVGTGVLLGDVNLDGAVNLLDVGPFVDLLTNSMFQLEGDINEDGDVNLLDVGPFVAILTGG